MNPLNHSLLLNRVLAAKAFHGTTAWSIPHKYFQASLRSLECLEDGIFFIGSSHIDDIATYSKEHIEHNNPDDWDNLPYDPLWCEFELRGFECPPKQHWGVLIHHGCGTVFCEDHGRKEIAGAAHFVFRRNEGESGGLCVEYSVNGPQENLAKALGGVYPGTTLTVDYIESNRKSVLAASVWIVSDFLAKLNCCNVHAIERRVSVNKRARRKNTRVISICKTLIVRDPKKRIIWDSDVTQSGQGADMKFHCVRGHFNNYGGDSGNGLLFGKLSGRYWWPQHYRGNAKHGVVAKDYKMEDKKGEKN